MDMDRCAIKINMKWKIENTFMTQNKLIQKNHFIRFNNI